MPDNQIESLNPWSHFSHIKLISKLNELINASNSHYNVLAHYREEIIGDRNEYSKLLNLQQTQLDNLIEFNKVLQDYLANEQLERKALESRLQAIESRFSFD